MFKNRKLVIATKHRKELVIAPVLEKELGVECFADAFFDTDTLGTFTGETERTLDPLEAARQKCRTAMELNRCDLAVASEGSFGPHPSLAFIAADEEILVLIDKAHQLEIVVKLLSLETNFSGKTVESEQELLAFAEASGFPEHALIVRKSKDSVDSIFKGINQTDELLRVYHLLKSAGSAPYVETDMRAMHNPTRMKVIAQAAQDLADKVNSRCPACSLPGFGIVDVKRGLPCDLCGFPTRAIMTHIYECKGCAHREEVMYPQQRRTEDPMYCDRCNP